MAQALRIKTVIVIWVAVLVHCYPSKFSEAKTFIVSSKTAESSQHISHKIDYRKHQHIIKASNNQHRITSNFRKITCNFVNKILCYEFFD